MKLFSFFGLGRRAVLLLAVLLLCLGAFPVFADGSVPSATDSEWEILRRLNDARAEAGLSPLSVFPALQSAATVRAAELHRAFSHTRPDGRDCFTALSEAKVSYRTAGENIALGYSSPQAVVEGWLHSEGHRKNILHADFLHVGIAQSVLGATTADTNLFVGGCAAYAVTLPTDTLTLPLGSSLAEARLTMTVQCAAHGASYLPLDDALCPAFDPQVATPQVITVKVGEATATLTVLREGDSASPSAPSLFSDVPTDAWYASAVTQAAALGWLRGNPDGTFAPDGVLNRAMAITVLGRVAKADPSAYQASAFSDAPLTAWYGGYAAWAKESGISNGTGDGRFDPEAPLTREQFCVLLVRLLAPSAKKDPSALQSFSDGSLVSDWARDACAYAISVGWFRGRPDGSLDPHSTVTRAEAAVLLLRCTENTVR